MTIEPTKVQFHIDRFKTLRKGYELRDPVIFTEVMESEKYTIMINGPEYDFWKEYRDSLKTSSSRPWQPIKDIKELTKALQQALDYIDGMLLGLQIAAGETVEIKPKRIPEIQNLHNILERYKL